MLISHLILLLCPDFVASLASSHDENPESLVYESNLILSLRSYKLKITANLEKLPKTNDI